MEMSNGPFFKMSFNNGIKIRNNAKMMYTGVGPKSVLATNSVS